MLRVTNWIKIAFVIVAIAVFYLLVNPILKLFYWIGIGIRSLIRLKRNSL